MLPRDFEVMHSSNECSKGKSTCLADVPVLYRENFTRIEETKRLLGGGEDKNEA